MVTVYFIILSEVNNMEHIFDYNVTVKKFAHFVWPSILMMVMIGLYYNMDSIFVANLVGEQALAALSMAYPVQGIMWGFAVMLAAGSSAIVAIKMGEGDQQGSCRDNHAKNSNLNILEEALRTAAKRKIVQCVIEGRENREQHDHRANIGGGEGCRVARSDH